MSTSKLRSGYGTHGTYSPGRSTSPTRPNIFVPRLDHQPHPAARPPLASPVAFCAQCGRPLLNDDDAPVAFEVTDEGLAIGLCEDCEVDLQYETFALEASWTSSPTAWSI
jgi:hypothetical protein